MKTKSKLYLLAATVAAFSSGTMPSIGQVFSSKDAISNRAVAASPRAKEAFPWLTRTTSVRGDACWATDEANNALTEAKKNRAYATSPRVRELFPELSRVPAPPREFTIAPSVEKNTAYLASPRAKEEFPHLLRSGSPATAKGGADKLKESDK